MAFTSSSRMQGIKHTPKPTSTPHRNPDTLDPEFDALVQKAESLLRNVLHVSTPLDVRDRLCTDLWNEAKPMIQLLREENTAVLRDMQIDFVRQTAV